MRDTPVTITVKLPQALARRLDAGARRRRIVRSAFVRDAIEAALRLQQGEGADGSVLSHCRDLAGCVEGPPDLSHNVKHLAGFGRRR
jgi:hypothetical protein